jgi:hypothetical protein
VRLDVLELLVSVVRFVGAPRSESTTTSEGSGVGGRLGGMQGRGRGGVGAKGGG